MIVRSLGVRILPAMAETATSTGFATLAKRAGETIAQTSQIQTKSTQTEMASAMLVSRRAPWAANRLAANRPAAVMVKLLESPILVERHQQAQPVMLAGMVSLLVR